MSTDTLFSSLATHKLYGTALVTSTRSELWVTLHGRTFVYRRPRNGIAEYARKCVVDATQEVTHKYRPHSPYSDSWDVLRSDVGLTRGEFKFSVWAPIAE